MNERRHESGEYLSYGQFRDFTQEFRDHAQEVREKLQEINGRLAQGAAKFTAQESDLEEATARSDSHSELLKALTEDKIRREEREAAQAASGAPKKALYEDIKRTVITAVVLGALAIGYNMWRDYEAGVRDKEKQSELLRAWGPPAGLPVGVGEDQPLHPPAPHPPAPVVTVPPP